MLPFSDAMNAISMEQLTPSDFGCTNGKTLIATLVAA